MILRTRGGGVFDVRGGLGKVWFVYFHPNLRRFGKAWIYIFLHMESLAQPSLSSSSLSEECGVFKQPRQLMDVTVISLMLFFFKFKVLV